MKTNAILKKMVMTILVALLSVGWMSGQTAVSTTTATQKSAWSVLNNILVDADNGTTPLKIYPPGFLDYLQSLGNSPFPPVDETALMQSIMSPQPMDLQSQPVIQDCVVIDLGTLGGTGSQAFGINNSGHVVGRSDTSGSTSHAFLYNGSMQDLGTLGGSDSSAYGINSSGKIVGEASVTGNTSARAFLYSGTSMQDLGTLGGNGSSANGINDSGQIVGRAGAYGGDHAFLYSGTTMQDLGTLGLAPSEARAINASGQVTGYSYIESLHRHSFLYPSDPLQDLGTLGGNDCLAMGINSAGQIVGYSTTSDGYMHAFLFADDAMQDIGTLSGDNYSIANGINSSGQIVGYSYKDGFSPIHAFLYSGGTMQDLNDLVDPAFSGWTLQYATAINDAGQIVGYGLNPQGQTHAFMLTPLPVGWKDKVTTTPPQLVYGNYPVKQPGKDSLIVITHGWQPYVTSLYPLPDVGWVDTMSNNIVAYLNSHGMNNWQVYGYKWVNNAWTVTAPDALYNAKGEGLNLGSAIAVQGWSHVHLIGHSAGAEVIQEASQWIKAAGATVQCTFLDPYVGNDHAGVLNYGNGNDWSDQYFSHDVTGDTTEQPLDNAYNVNVTQLGPKQGIGKFRSQTTGQMEVCTRTIKYHGWPIDFYMNTITGNNVDGDYAGFGFLKSKEGGGWSSGVPSLTEGNGTPGHSEGIRLLGTADPSCVNDIQITAPTWPNLIPDFTSWITIQSDTGSNQKGVGVMGLTPGSPSWVATVITATNPVNTVSFDAQFSGVTGSEDMLSVIWDTNTVGTIDERIVSPGLQHYSITFNTAAANSVHVLSFRLDPFTSSKSSILLTNMVLTQVGPALPFTLSVTTNTSNGLLVWQLTGEAGYAYGIQASSDLTSTNWTDIAELLNTNGAVQFYDQDSTNYPMRFYRAYVPIKQ